MKEQKFDYRKYIKENSIETGTFKATEIVVEKKNPYNDVDTIKKNKK